MQKKLWQKLRHGMGLILFLYKIIIFLTKVNRFLIKKILLKMLNNIIHNMRLLKLKMFVNN
jgi:hypothetical protein